MKHPSALSLYRSLAGARFRIFAFPHAGGGASAFMKLRTALAHYQVELCPLQPPGRENRTVDPASKAIEDLAAEFADAVESLAPRPMAFLGHSLGGLVAYTTARLLRDRNSTYPDHIIVSASRSPTRQRAPGNHSPSCSIRDRILSFGGIPEAILANQELFEMFETIIAADIAMGDAYRHIPTAPLYCPITVYSGTKDSAALPENAGEWQALTAHKIRKRTFNGRHFFLYDNPEVTADALAEDLKLVAEATHLHGKDH